MSIYCSPVAANINKTLCGTKRGGVKGEIYVANLADIDSITSSTNDKNMDTIVMKTNPTTSAPYFWYRIGFKKNTAGMNNEVQFGNNIFVNQSVAFSIEEITADSLAALEKMVDGEAVFIVKDYQGVAHVLGRVGGLMASEMALGTGQAADDLYGGAIVFSSEEPEFSNIVVAGTTIEVDNGAGGVDTVTL